MGDLGSLCYDYQSFIYSTVHVWFDSHWRKAAEFLRIAEIQGTNLENIFNTIFAGDYFIYTETNHESIVDLNNSVHYAWHHPQSKETEGQNTCLHVHDIGVSDP